MAGNGLLNIGLNWLILHSPFWVQLLCMERVMKSVKSQLEKQASKKIQFETKGGVCAGRPNRAPSTFRTTRLDLLDLWKQNQQKYPKTKLPGRYSRARATIVQRGHAHVGQRGPGPRIL